MISFWLSPWSRLTVPSSVFATQTIPFAATTSSGLRPTGIGSPSGWLAFASRRVSVFPTEFET